MNIKQQGRAGLSSAITLPQRFRDRKPLITWTNTHFGYWVCFYTLDLWCCINCVGGHFKMLSNAIYAAKQICQRGLNRRRNRLNFRQCWRCVGKAVTQWFLSNSPFHPSVLFQPELNNTNKHATVNKMPIWVYWRNELDHHVTLNTSQWCLCRCLSMLRCTEARVWDENELQPRRGEEVSGSAGLGHCHWDLPTLGHCQ